ncbi:MAG TPA: FtsK/SpoIIIE domain-containing protein [Actinomycetota bacterium]|nr:FtsK/SpoIIIE domain-containing protein [Actinomycetota bacterium]
MLRDEEADVLAEHLARYVDERRDALPFTDFSRKPLSWRWFREHVWVPGLKASGLPAELTPGDLGIAQLRALQIEASAVRAGRGAAMSDRVRRVGPRMIEAPPPNVEPVAMPGAGMLRRLLRVLWAYRVELALVALGYELALVLIANLGRYWGVGGAGVLGVVMFVGPVRRFLARVLPKSRLRRRLMRAARHVGLANHNDRVPLPVAVSRVPLGDVVRVRLAKGGHAGELEDALDALAAVLEVREVRVARDPDNARYASVTIVRRDPLAGTKALVCSWLSAVRMNLWSSFPLGVGEHGAAVSMCVAYRNLLLGGELGGGKSSILQLVIAAAALDPAVRLSLFDGKRGVELGEWRRVADHFSCSDVDDAIEVLRELWADMVARYELLVARGRRKVEPGDAEVPLRVVCIDELAEYTAGVDRKASAESSSLLRDLVSKGRAAGIIVVDATQKPASDIVPTSLRDLFAFRWALRCTTPQASDTIHGQGWASQGYSAAGIDAACRGVGFLLAEGGLPERLKAFYLSDDDVASLARRAEALRARARLAVVPQVAEEVVAHG